MEKELRVIVIEDDDVACNCFANCAQELETVNVLECTNDSVKGLKLVEEYLPDVVILDLELNDGKGSGIEFLDGLKELDINYKPFVLITTNNPSAIIHDFIRKAGADFIMSKQKKDYSEKEALEFLVTVKDSIVRKSSSKDRESFIKDTEENREKRLKNKIIRELDYVGINPKFLGYNYLADAILLVINGEKENMLNILGEKYHKTNSSVERAMQTAINKAWRTSDIDELLEHYTARISSEKGVPTLMEFIYYYVKKVQE